MRCQSCGQDLGGPETRVAFICAEVMGDEYVESYWLCPGCDTYTKSILRDRFLGETSERGGGSLPKEDGDRLIELIRGCPDPSDESCQCAAHREVRGGAGSGGARCRSLDRTPFDPRLDDDGNLALSGFLDLDEYWVVVDKDHHHKLLKSLVIREFGSHKTPWREIIGGAFREPFFRSVFEDLPIDTQSYRRFLTSKAIILENDRQLVDDAHRDTLLLALVERAFGPSARAYVEFVDFLDRTGIPYAIHWP